jgi:hypothetical protein
MHVGKDTLGYEMRMPSVELQGLGNSPGRFPFLLSFRFKAREMLGLGFSDPKRLIAQPGLF